MARIPIEPGLLDDDVLDAPHSMTAEEFFAEGGPGWRRRGGETQGMEED